MSGFAFGIGFGIGIVVGGIVTLVLAYWMAEP